MVRQRPNYYFWCRILNKIVDEFLHWTAMLQTIMTVMRIRLRTAKVTE